MDELEGVIAHRNYRSPKLRHLTSSRPTIAGAITYLAHVARGHDVWRLWQGPRYDRGGGELLRS